LKSESGGTVTGVKVKAGQVVRKGELLMSFDNEELQMSKDTNDLKLQDLQNQLAAAQEQLEYYRIDAPFDGIITALAIEEGNSVKQTDALVTISDMSRMVMEVAVDELDIAKIETGQEAVITIDAIAETEANHIKGKVSSIAAEGTSSNGVTTYPVLVEMDGMQKLKMGMNADAEIVISRKTGVLTVPIEAVQKFNGKSFVTVVRGTSGNGQSRQLQTQGGQSAAANQADGSQTGQRQSANRQPRQSDRQSQRTSGQSQAWGANNQLAQAAENTVRVPVETGIQDDENIEIVSGLNEGDQVVIPSASSGSSTQFRQGGMPMGIPVGGMGGGFNRR
jgi:HlyD family secretion protein